MAQIVVHALSKTYQVGTQTIKAVHDVSLSVEQGEFISIVGHSGSGKTTLLSLIGGITVPSSGSIFFQGKEISSLSSDELSGYRSEQMGFMFQFASLLPLLTVRENLLLPTLFSQEQSSIAKMTSKAEELIAMVGLGDRMDSYPAQLSGGQQRRVAIARAFMNGPRVILADEPTGDLDEDTEQDMMDFFKRMNRDAAITFLMVTHNSDLAKQCGRIIRMQHGSIQSL